MLVLSRIKGESIIIGDNIKVSVLDIKGDSVSIGIEAPRRISVHRQEIYNAIHSKRQEQVNGQEPSHL